MDEAHLLACARYVELYPARAHLAGRDDDLVQAAPLLEQVGDWAAFLAEGLGADARAATRSGERTGRSPGDASFLAALERDLGRTRCAPRSRYDSSQHQCRSIRSWPDRPRAVRLDDRETKPWRRGGHRGTRRKKKD
jgi:hypothetical protein